VNRNRHGAPVAATRRQCANSIGRVVVSIQRCHAIREVSLSRPHL
jgi:hypothetical protein